MQHNTTVKQTRFYFCLGMGPGASLEWAPQSPSHPHNCTREFSKSALVCGLCWTRCHFKICLHGEIEKSQKFQGCNVTTPCGATGQQKWPQQRRQVKCFWYLKKQLRPWKKVWGQSFKTLLPPCSVINIRELWFRDDAFLIPTLKTDSYAGSVKSCCKCIIPHSKRKSKSTCKKAHWGWGDAVQELKPSEE